MKSVRDATGKNFSVDPLGNVDLTTGYYVFDCTECDVAFVAAKRGKKFCCLKCRNRHNVRKWRAARK